MVSGEAGPAPVGRGVPSGIRFAELFQYSGLWPPQVKIFTLFSLLFSLRPFGAGYVLSGVRSIG